MTSESKHKYLHLQDSPEDCEQAPPVTTGPVQTEAGGEHHEDEGHQEPLSARLLQAALHVILQLAQHAQPCEER